MHRLARAVAVEDCFLLGVKDVIFFRVFWSAWLHQKMMKLELPSGKRSHSDCWKIYHFSIGNTWVFPKIGGKPPKSSILIGFSLIFTIHFGVPLFLVQHPHRRNTPGPPIFQQPRAVIVDPGVGTWSFPFVSKGNRLRIFHGNSFGC